MNFTRIEISSETIIILVNFSLLFFAVMIMITNKGLIARMKMYIIVAFWLSNQSLLGWFFLYLSGYNKIFNKINHIIINPVLTR